ncbi:MAG: formimidoylglutamase [Planctomycetes bacterium]|nr:formimidoylglutamase [Planctomycetota bacterium]
MSVWTGRVDTADGPDALRWHQMVKPLAPDAPPGVVLIGFACDEGVRRNGGRVGAKDGPQAIRAALANLAWHQHFPVYDAGDVRCDDGDMEGAQARLAEVVASAIRAGHRPLILGGGHETAWGTFQGIVSAKPNAKLSVINIDAHLDLRADEPGNSGTPFNQMAKWCAARGRAFRYLCVGTAEPSNTLALFNHLAELGGEHIPDTDFVPLDRKEPRDYVAEFVRRSDSIHLSIDLDVLPPATMPAVSAPAARGIAFEAVELVLDHVLPSGKVVAVDLVELNPRLDTDVRGARTAARLAWQVVKDWDRQEEW